jgi:hypothetical protein
MAAARKFVGVRLAPTGRAAIQELADREAGGNLSEMVRRLLSEAVTARRKR